MQYEVFSRREKNTISVAYVVDYFPVVRWMVCILIIINILCINLVFQSL